MNLFPSRSLRSSFHRPLAFAWLAFASATIAAAQSPLRKPAPAGANANSSVRLIANIPEGAGLSSFVGREVRDRNGQPLGKIKDVYIDAHSGRGVYAAVADGAGNTLRLVPIAAIAMRSRADSIALPIDQKQWEQITPANVPIPDAMRITISAGESRQLAQTFGQPSRPSDSGAHLIAVSEVRGKRVSTGVDHVGAIDEVILDGGPDMAAVVISPEKDFKVAARKFVVPVHQLSLGARDLNPIGTALTRADFEKARDR